MNDSAQRPDAPVAAPVGTGILVYGAMWCSDCRRSKGLLDRLGVAYSWVDLEAEPDQVAEVTSRNEGRQRIPTIVFGDGSWLSEPSDPQLRARLDSLGITTR
ncbi:MAG: glutaredoxin family protein [Actinomycetes bacterium]